MQELLSQLAVAVERGKVDVNAVYPPDMAGQEGTSELTIKLLDINAPVTDRFSAKIKADGYFANLQGLTEHLKLLQVT